MDEKNKKLLSKALHDFLRNGEGREKKYPFELLSVLCTTFCAMDEKKGFLNFMNHIDLLPTIAKRCLLKDSDFLSFNPTPIINYVIVQSASVLLGNGNCFLAVDSSDGDGYDGFEDIVLNGYDTLPTSLDVDIFRIYSIGADYWQLDKNIADAKNFILWEEGKRTNWL